jgi:hypothetical protein
MAVYMYLNLNPEALIASMLPPVSFGNYLAVGKKKHATGEAKYFQIDPGFKSDYFRMADVEKKCVPHEDGEPKHSVYVSIYRVLENLPIEAIGNLYLTTRDGRVLEIKPNKAIPAFPQKYFLYQEIAPVSPRVVSTLDPRKFAQFMTDPQKGVELPKIFFTDLRLEKLAEDPGKGSVWNLPYSSIEHLRDCLIDIRNRPGKATKIVERTMVDDFPYRTVQNGFYLADSRNFIYYPMPGENEMQSVYFDWWRSATR